MMEKKVPPCTASILGAVFVDQIRKWKTLVFEIGIFLVVSVEFAVRYLLWKAKGLRVRAALGRTVEDMCVLVGAWLHVTLYTVIHDDLHRTMGPAAATFVAYAIVWFVARRTSLIHGWLCRFWAGVAALWIVLTSATPAVFPVVVAVLPTRLLWWPARDTSVMERKHAKRPRTGGSDEAPASSITRKRMREPENSCHSQPGCIV